MENSNTINFENASLYVACLESYNNGSLVGKWLKLSDFDNAEEFLNEISNIIKGEEFAFHDCEYIPNHFYSEYLGESDIQKIYDFFEAVEKFENEDLKDVFFEYCTHNGLEGTAEDIEEFENNLIGYFEDGLEGYAYDSIEEIEMPDFAKRYFDYDAFERDLGHDGYYSINDYVFLNQ